MCFTSQEWFINTQKMPVFGMKLPTGFQLIGQVVRRSYGHISDNSLHISQIILKSWYSYFNMSQGLSEYAKWLAHYSAKQRESPVKPITCRSYAR